MEPVTMIALGTAGYLWWKNRQKKAADSGALPSGPPPGDGGDFASGGASYNPASYDPGASFGPPPSAAGPVAPAPAPAPGPNLIPLAVAPAAAPSPFAPGSIILAHPLSTSLPVNPGATVVRLPGQQGGGSLLSQYMGVGIPAANQGAPSQAQAAPPVVASLPPTSSLPPIAQGPVSTFKDLLGGFFGGGSSAQASAPGSVPPSVLPPSMRAPAPSQSTATPVFQTTAAPLRR